MQWLFLPHFTQTLSNLAILFELTLHRMFKNSSNFPSYSNILSISFGSHSPVLIILPYFMDFAFGFGNFVNDVLDVRAELARLADKLRASLFRFNRQFKDFSARFAQEDEQLVGVYARTKERALELSVATDNKLKKIGIAGRIQLSVPFDKTKTKLKEVTDDLDEAITAMKERLEEGKLERIIGLKLEGFQEKLNAEIKGSLMMAKLQAGECHIYDNFEEMNDGPDFEKDFWHKQQQSEQVVFPPTQSYNDASFSQMDQEEYGDEDRQNREIEISIQVTNNNIIMAAAKELSDYKSKQLKDAMIFGVSKNMEDVDVLQFNRRFFEPIYTKIMGAIKDLSFISSKNSHFELKLMHVPEEEKKEQEVEKEEETKKQQQVDPDVEAAKPTSKQEESKAPSAAIQPSKKKEPRLQEILFSAAKQCLSDSIPNSAGTEFFSFPKSFPSQFSISSSSPQWNEFKIMLFNKSVHGTFVKKYNTSQWLVIKEEIEIENGDEIAPLMERPERIKPLFSLKMGITKRII